MFKHIDSGWYWIEELELVLSIQFKAIGTSSTNPGYLVLSSDIGYLRKGNKVTSKLVQGTFFTPKEGDKDLVFESFDLKKKQTDIATDREAILKIAEALDARVEGAVQKTDGESNVKSIKSSVEFKKLRFMIQEALIRRCYNERFSFLGSLTATELDTPWKEMPKLTLPSGVCVVLGGSNRGKSSFLADLYLCNRGKVGYISFGEPDMIAISETKELANCLNLLFFDEKKDVVIVDSARSFLYGPSNSTGQGGVNNELFVMLSKISAELAKVNKILVISVNPMTSRAEAIDSISQALEGSVSSLINLGFEGGSRILPFFADMTSRLFNQRQHFSFCFKREEESERAASKSYAFGKVDSYQAPNANLDRGKLLKLYKSILGG